MGSGEGRIDHLATAIQAEATACLEAIQTASEWGMTNVRIETDCQSLARAFESTDYNLAPEGVLFKEIRSFASLNFNSIKYMFVPRDCNKLAHAMAVMGANGQAARQLWPDSVPDDVNVSAASASAEPV
uniref:RNase H type-1 domain-containing protein n=1 Tax=Hordeum vulgare subsp. vulgare TaxID=112509 RepID=A0A8I6YA59_HORVV